MKILPIQEVYRQKFDRQRKIKGLQYHAAGHCVHIGKLSPGCYGCFVPDPFRVNIQLGIKCNLNCQYCTSEKPGKESNIWSEEYIKATLLGKFHQQGPATSISFTGPGEPLMHIGKIKDSMIFCKELEKETGKRPWYYLYTNGLLADKNMISLLRDLGFDEVRFHLGATNFSEKVLENLHRAAHSLHTVTVETPSWPPHHKKLFEILPLLEDAGVKHLNITEVEVNKANFGRIASAVPDGKICACGELQLYDEGVVYDIIEEVIRKNYSYSVLDCNCFVKLIQRSSGKWVYHEDVAGLCAEHDF